MDILIVNPSLEILTWDAIPYALKTLHEIAALSRYLTFMKVYEYITSTQKDVLRFMEHMLEQILMQRL